MSDFDELLSFLSSWKKGEKNKGDMRSGIEMQQKQEGCSEIQGISLYFVL